jgi:hypothetical protein
MKRFYCATLLLFAAMLFSVNAAAQTVTFTASNIRVGGVKLASGTLCALPVDNSNHPLPASALGGSAPGALLASAACTTVTTGALPGGFLLPDTALTTPAHVCLRITVTDANQNGKTVYNSPCAQPASSGASTWCSTSGGVTTCNFDNYTPNLGAQALVTSGPPGPAGTANWRGAWAATTAYARNDGFVQGGNGYIVTAAYTSGGSFGSTDTTNTVAVATGCPLAGCTYTGAVYLNGDPSTSTQAATKQYVDAHVAPNLGIWQRAGTVIPAVSQCAYATQEPSPEVRTDPQILTGRASVLAMWFTCGWLSPVIAYAESADGITWTPYSNYAAVLPTSSTGYAHGRVHKIGSTFYAAYANIDTSGIATGWDFYTSSNGITWTLAASQAITVSDLSWGTYINAGNIDFWQEGSTWYAIVEGQDNLTGGNWHDGLMTATSFTGPYTAVAGNPIYSVTGKTYGSPNVHKIGSTYYNWILGTTDGMTGNLPTDLFMYQTSSLSTNVWTRSLTGNVLSRLTIDEGAQNSAEGQLGDPRVIEWNGNSYLLYDGTDTQSPTSTNPGIHIKMAFAPMPLATVITTQQGNGGNLGVGGGTGSTVIDIANTTGYGFVAPGAVTVASDNFTRADGALGSNWTVESGASTTGTLNIYSNAVKPTASGARAVSYWAGAGTFSANQWASAQIVTAGGAGATSLGSAAVRASSGDNYYECEINLTATLPGLALQKVVAGAFTALSSTTSYAMLSGDVIEITASGSTLVCQDVTAGVTVTATDTALTTGTPGLGGYNTSTTSTTSTNWSGGNLGAGAPSLGFGTGAKTGTCTAPSMWLRTDGSTGSSGYACIGGNWAAIF